MNRNSNLSPLVTETTGMSWSQWPEVPQNQIGARPGWSELQQQTSTSVDMPLNLEEVGIMSHVLFKYKNNNKKV